VAAGNSVALGIEHQAVDAEEMIVFDVMDGAFWAQEVNTTVEEADVKVPSGAKARAEILLSVEGPGFRWECRYPNLRRFCEGACHRPGHRVHRET